MSSFENVEGHLELSGWVKPTSAKRPRLEIISRLPSKPRRGPPIVFVHGAWHAAWCWEENFLDYFASKGFATYAVSLRGHGGSEGRSRVRFARIRDYVDDLASVVASLESPPVLIGHSMGGFVVQKYLERAAVPMAVLMASVPPTGAFPMMRRTMRDQPLDMLRANLMFSMKPLISNMQRAHAALFSPSMPRNQVAKYHARLQEETVVGFFDYLFRDLVKTDKIKTPMVVIGGRSDKTVLPSEIKATARAYGVEPTFFDDTAHDMMLEARWRNVADKIFDELEAHLRTSNSFDETLRATA